MHCTSLKALKLITLVLISSACEKDCADSLNVQIIGTWEGAVYSATYRDGVLLSEGTSTGLAEFRSDYSGTISRIIFLGTFPVDTIQDAFQYSYIPESQILDLLISSNVPGEDWDFEKTYHIEITDKDKMYARWKTSGLSIDGTHNENIEQWDLMKK